MPRLLSAKACIAAARLAMAEPGVAEADNRGRSTRVSFWPWSYLRLFEFGFRWTSEIAIFGEALPTPISSPICLTVDARVRARWEAEIGVTTRIRRIRERAYAIWELEGRVHGNELAHWFRAEAEIPPRITFDSNAYRQAVDPSRSRRDASLPELQRINTALREGRIRGFLSETVATLEGVRNTQRGSYFSSVRLQVDVREEVISGGTIKLRLTAKPNDTLNPQLPAVAAQWISASLALGFKFLYAPRLGIPRPKELMGNVFEVEVNDQERARRQSRFSAILGEIEARGLGSALIRGIGDKINARLAKADPWSTSLNQPKDASEELDIRKAVNEWADGDTVATHYSYEHDYLCSADLGRSSGGTPSVLDATNRAWLSSTYGVKFLTLTQLAAMV